jgi:hypothetical protein
MAEKKRTEFQIERDRFEISQLYARADAWSQQRIVDELYRRRVEEYEKAVAAGEADPPKPYRLTRQMISYDLKALQESWKKLSAFDLDEMKGRILEKIDEVERKAWEGYERSCGVVEDMRRQKVTFEREREEADVRETYYENGKVEKVTKIIPGKHETRTTEQRKRSELIGNPRFLQVIASCIERRCKLLGLDAPTEMKHSGTLNLADLVKSATEPSENNTLANLT